MPNRILDKPLGQPTAVRAEAASHAYFSPRAEAASHAYFSPRVDAAAHAYFGH